MARLGATRITPVMKGDASKDIEVQFVNWSSNTLWPALLSGGSRDNNNSSGEENNDQNTTTRQDDATKTNQQDSSTEQPLKWDSLTDNADGLLRPVVKDKSDHVPLAEYRRNKRKAKRAARLKARAADLMENDEDRLNASLVDLEDLGSAMAKGKASVSEEIAVKPSDRPEMVTPMQRKALTKEGYSIIGKKLFGGGCFFLVFLRYRYVRD